MTDRSDVERALDRYLAEGETVLPNWVLNDALNQIEDTRERRAVRVPWRFPEMNSSRPDCRDGCLAAAALTGLGREDPEIREER
jgi:hypothetical protein